MLIVHISEKCDVLLIIAYRYLLRINNLKNRFLIGDEIYNDIISFDFIEN